MMLFFEWLSETLRFVRCGRIKCAEKEVANSVLDLDKALHSVNRLGSISGLALLLRALMELPN